MQEKSYVNPNGFQLNNYTRVETLGKGHCLFAGFSLGLVDLLFCGEFDLAGAAGQFKEYLQFFSEVIGKQGSSLTWDEYKTVLIKNRANVQNLQLTLATAQRKLLIHLMNQPPVLPSIMLNGAAKELSHAELLDKALAQGNDLFQSLVSEFHDFVLVNTQKNRKKSAKKKMTVQKSGGDIFNRCNQIKSKFAELLIKMNEGSTEDQASLELLHWYCAEGFEYFKQHMSTTDGWGGPIEARILAKYWGVTVFTVQHLSARAGVREFFGQPDCVYNANSLPEQQFIALPEQVRTLLVMRGLVSREVDGDVREILISDEQDIRESLEPIHDSGDIIEIWEAFWEQNNYKTPPTHFWQPDADQSTDILRLLMDRNIINRREGAYYFNFANDKPRLEQALSGIENQAIIQEMVTLLGRNQNHNRSFVIVNSDSNHWEYYQRVGMPWSELIGKLPNAAETNWEDNLSDEEPEGKPEESSPEVSRAKTKTTARRTTVSITVKRKREEDLEEENEQQAGSQPVEQQNSSPPLSSQASQPAQQLQASAAPAPDPSGVNQAPVKKLHFTSENTIVNDATMCLQQLENYRIKNNINPFMGEVSGAYKALNRFFWYVKQYATIQDTSGDDCALLLEIGNKSELWSLYPVAVGAFVQKHYQEILSSYSCGFLHIVFKLSKLIDICFESYAHVMQASFDRATAAIIKNLHFSMILYINTPCDQYLNDFATQRFRLMQQCQPYFSESKIPLSGFFSWYQLSFFKRTNVDEFNNLIVAVLNGVDAMYHYIDNLKLYMKSQRLTKNDVTPSPPKL